jgi:hypothetical protein
MQLSDLLAAVGASVISDDDLTLKTQPFAHHPDRVSRIGQAVLKRLALVQAWDYD